MASLTVLPYCTTFAEFDKRELEESLKRCLNRCRHATAHRRRSPEQYSEITSNCTVQYRIQYFTCIELIGVGTPDGLRKTRLTTLLTPIIME